MAKTLFIVRHAQANQAGPGQSDKDRPLSPEGLHHASRVGIYFHQHYADISAIVCSGALRAIQTSEQIADQINFDVAKIKIDEELYEASVRILLNTVNQFNDDWNEVILVGHNPVISYFVEYVSGHHFSGMEAGSIVKIAMSQESWKELSADNASFEYYISPLDI